LILQTSSETVRNVGERFRAPRYLAKQNVPLVSKTLSCRRGEFVFHQGQSATRLFEVVSGAFAISKTDADGRQHIVEIVSDGWVFGFSNGGDYGASSYALIDSTVLAYAKSDFDEAGDLEDRKRLSNQIGRQVCALHDQTFLLSKKSAQERVAAFLMRFVSGRGAPGCSGPEQDVDSTSIQLIMSRHEIADYLGLTHETVSRAIGNLKTKGVIAREHGDKRSLHINNVCDLCKAAHNDCEL
jgi:CRP-like cAMP-binding protein